MKEEASVVTMGTTPGMEPNTRTRLDSIDATRGIVMILMALDHVRDYFSSATFSPLDLSQTTPVYFFTRWVTHLCAPAFVLLAGTSAFLWANMRGKSKTELARFLLTRGLWLIVLELTIIRLAWFFRLDYEIALAQVIWAIGWSMIALAGLVFLPQRLILAFAIVMIARHNLLDHIAPPEPGFLSSLWTVLHQPGTVETLSGYPLFILYPLIPWIGVMALGYAMGPLFLREQSERRNWLLSLGLGSILAFILLRALNIYGDPIPWSEQRSSVFTFLSFLNVEKYPPSLLFLLITLGPAFIALALLERSLGSMTRPVATLGRAPLFFYVSHLFVIHGLAILLALVHYGRADWLIGAAWLSRGRYPGDYGYDLSGVYLIWIAVVITLYPICKWFANFKREHQDWWLSYL